VVVTEHHEHRMVLLGYLDEGYGPRPVRWCLDCGVAIEEFGEGRYAELVPEWSKEKLEAMDRAKEIYRHVTSMPLSAVRRKKKRLGRSLKDLIAQEQNIKMHKLFPGPGESK